MTMVGIFCFLWTYAIFTRTENFLADQEWFNVRCKFASVTWIFKGNNALRYISDSSEGKIEIKRKKIGYPETFFYRCVITKTYAIRALRSKYLISSCWRENSVRFSLQTFSLYKVVVSCTSYNRLDAYLIMFKIIFLTKPLYQR